ncbi:DNA polymerase III subunit delta [Alkalibacillus almallahensis]|uniref:DNA polymerase III subunit delta n=1 Tax=Alkalibacillus almallahensis TaxID=1379154 RepID=UPI00141FDADB|nr:DNA polymerase III subunit delta [Alkalibacillus almallahensis]NIK11316.1 DNA polymerase-3 subunit delta [Alkalibacillus almallahensis]
MHAQQFVEQKKITVAPIYLLYGDEPFFIQQSTEKIINQIREKDPEVDQQNYDMETVSVQEAIHDAETFPFFSDHKIVSLNRASFLTGQAKSEIEHDLDVLTEYVKQPTEFTTLIIIAPYEKLDQRRKIVKTLKEHCELIDCSPPDLRQMNDVIKQMADSFELSLSEPVIDLLVERVGDHLEALQSELHKLSLYFGTSDVNYNEAEPLVSTYAETSTFSLIDALVDNRLGEALNILKALRKQNEEPIALLALVTSQIRLILQCKLLKRRGYQQQQIAKQMRVHPYAVKMALKRERSFSETALKSALSDGAETDEKLKTGQMDKWLSIEMYLQSIMRHLSQTR